MDKVQILFILLSFIVLVIYVAILLIGEEIRWQRWNKETKELHQKELRNDLEKISSSTEFQKRQEHGNGKLSNKP